MDAPRTDGDRPSKIEIRRQLQRMLHAAEFEVRLRASRMLRFFIEESLRNGFKPITQRAIATHALGLDEDFNPTLSGLVRVNVRRLRKAVELYFSGTGRHDPVVFELTPGPYRILATRNTRAAPDARPPQPPREIRRSLPILLFVEPAVQECDEEDDDHPLGASVALRVTSHFVESALVTVIGPLRRDRFTTVASGQTGGPTPIATIAATLGYDYVVEPALRAEGGRCYPRLSVIDASNGEVIEHATDSLGPFADTAAAAHAAAAWIVNRISECFLAPPEPVTRR
jgi:TolB-like protein